MDVLSHWMRRRNDLGAAEIAMRLGCRHDGAHPQVPRLHCFPLLVLPKINVGIKTNCPLEFEPHHLVLSLGIRLEEDSYVHYILKANFLAIREEEEEERWYVLPGASGRC